MMGYGYNNFFGWFPGEYYRERTKHNPKLICDLDIILQEINFNIESFHQLRRRQHAFMEETSGLAGLVKEGLELTPEQQKRSQELGLKMEVIYRILDMMLEPVYKKMRQLGYSHEDLIR